jgi:uncharacterized protein (TIGR02996 family)
MSGVAEEELLRAVRDDPDDDAPRLVYADWLEERGDPRAEFIRVQCELARLGEGDPRRRRLRARERAILARHRAEWIAPLAELGHVPWYFEHRPACEFRRGFAEFIALECDDFLRRAGRLFEKTPVRHLRLWTDGRNEKVPQLAALPLLARVAVLDLSKNELGLCGPGIGPFAESPHLARLRGLVLYENFLGSRQVATLTRSTAMPRLESLSFGWCSVRSAGAAALARSPSLRSLRYLDLSGESIGLTGVRAIASSRHLAGLTHLAMMLPPPGDEGARALAASRHLDALVCLRVGPLGREGEEALHRRFGPALQLGRARPWTYE